MNPRTPAHAPQLRDRFALIDGLEDWADADPGTEDAWNADLGPAEQWDLHTGERVACGPHGPVPVRVYAPVAASEAPRPALVWVHGGAFMWGDIDMPEADAVARGIAGRAGAVVVSVDYRLVDEPLPDGGTIPCATNPGGVSGLHAPVPLDDVHAAFGWTHAHAADLGIDPSRIAIGGASAGGNLAAAATLRLADEAAGEGEAGTAGGSPVVPAASLLMYPAVHVGAPEATDEEAAAFAVTPPVLRWDESQLVWMTENYLGRPAATATADDFPSLATPEQLARLPRTYIEVDEFDDLRTSGRAYAEQIDAAGGAVHYAVRHGVPHGHLNRVGLAEAHASMDQMAQIMREL